MHESEEGGGETGLHSVSVFVSRLVPANIWVGSLLRCAGLATSSSVFPAHPACNVRAISSDGEWPLASHHGWEERMSSFTNRVERRISVEVRYYAGIGRAHALIALALVPLGRWALEIEATLLE